MWLAHRDGAMLGTGMRSKIEGNRELARNALRAH